MAKAKPRIGEAVTANYGWTKPTVGASDDAWGGYINADLDAIDSTVHSVQTSIPTVPSASATQPVMDGTATAGSSPQWSRGDHIHPTDTSLYPASNPSGYQTVANVTASLAPYLPRAGVTDGSNAPAGQIGEVISSLVASPGVTLTNAATANITSISLTAGDWDVCGEVWVSVGTGAPTSLHGGIGPTSATLPGSALNTSRVSLISTVAPSAVAVMPLRMCRVSLATTTTYYLVAQVTFPSGTTTAFGSVIARRAR